MRPVPFKTALSSCFVITKLLSLTRDCQYVQSSRQRLDWANMQVTGSLSHIVSLWLLTSSMAPTHVRSPGANQEDWRCCQDFTFFMTSSWFCIKCSVTVYTVSKCAVHMLLILTLCAGKSLRTLILAGFLSWVEQKIVLEKGNTRIWMLSM